MCWTDFLEYVFNWYSRVCVELILTSMCWTDGREYVLNWNSRVLCNISLQLAALGGFILIFGFVAFNGGALGTISNPGDGAKIGLILTNTVVAGSFGAISCMAIEKLFRTRYWSLLMSINGALTGMVSYCSSSCVADRSLYICLSVDNDQNLLIKHTSCNYDNYATLYHWQSTIWYSAVKCSRYYSAHTTRLPASP